MNTYYGLRVYRSTDTAMIGLESTPEGWLASMMEVMDQVWRVLRDDGICWVNLGDSYSGSGKGPPGKNSMQETNGAAAMNDKRDTVNGGQLLGIPWRFALAMQERGWILRSDVIWAKKSPMPESLSGSRWEQEKDGTGLVLRNGSWRCTSSHEHIFQFAKRMSYWSDGEAVKVASLSDHPSGNGYKRDARKTYQNADGSSRGNDLAWEMSSHANRRNVWRDIRPEPYGGEHFSTFPPDLPRICIQASTSEAGVCSRCGAQWSRVVERESHQTQQSWNGAGRANGCIAGGGHEGRTGQWDAETRTLSWRPTCGCNADKVPATVLDPFAGTGTTLLAAMRLGRRSYGTDLSEDYLKQAVGRLSKQSLPMGL